MDALNCAYEGRGATAGPLLPGTLREGVVVLLHKGGTLPPADPASYRPITLLNCDHKILATTLVRRWSPLADLVVDPTQSAFIPGRWIGDNILFHLEEIDYCAATQQSGVILFLDWQKAYDRLDQAWVVLVMERMGFTAPSRRWAAMMMRGVSGQVLVLQDMLDIPAGRKAKFVRNFMQGATSIEDAIRRYVVAVKDGSFPGPEHCYAD